MALRRASNLYDSGLAWVTTVGCAYPIDLLTLFATADR